MIVNKGGANPIVVGKRVTIGAAVGSVATVFSDLFPGHATAIIASATAITFIIQIGIAHWYGITTKQ